jgi:hypothetical protein
VEPLSVPPDDEPDEEPDDEPDEEPDEDPDDEPDEEPDASEGPSCGAALELDEQPPIVRATVTAHGAIASAYGKIEIIFIKRLRSMEATVRPTLRTV